MFNTSLAYFFALNNFIMYEGYGLGVLKKRQKNLITGKGRKGD